MSETTFLYKGIRYPEYLKHGNAMQFIEPMARQFCQGKGLDVGAGPWPLPVDRALAHNASQLPEGTWDYIFSSHCLEHLTDPVAAIEHWKTKLRVGGTLFLYLPHPDMAYWRPQHCRKHLHLFHPKDIAQLLWDLGFSHVIHSERDLAWSFAAVGFNGEAQQ
jgi:SAM-dependent methyltransferase